MGSALTKMREQVVKAPQKEGLLGQVMAFVRNVFACFNLVISILPLPILWEDSCISGL